MKTLIQDLITETVRALYSKPDFCPVITVAESRSSIAIDVDVSPWNPGLLIGERGSMKFALELLIAYAAGLDTDRGVSIYVSSMTRFEIERTAPQPADGSKIKPLAEVLAVLLEGTVKIETAETAVMAIFELPEDLARSVKPPLSKVIRAAGKAAGFNALPYVHVLR